MRRLLGTPITLVAILTALLTALVTGCGTEDEPGATTPSATEEPTSTPPPTGEGDPAAAKLVDLLSASAAGGLVNETLTEVTEEKALAAFVSQFRGDLAASVRDTVESAARTHDTMYAGVVYLGCDVPTDVEIEQLPDEIRATPGKIANPTPECLVAVTTVAVVAVG